MLDNLCKSWQPGQVRRADDQELRLAVSRALEEEAVGLQPLQALWSGYGQIVRVQLASGRSVVVKSVCPPAVLRHPRGHATARSHQRKLRSYAVEHSFYGSFAPRCVGRPVLARALHLEGEPHSSGAARSDGRDHSEGPASRWFFILEDLDQQGYSRRAGWLGPGDVDACLAWLAAFHARFLGTSPEGLWEEGCYWHLETRPDEWALMPAGELKDRARELDRALAQARFRTLVHGDAKVANFCFSREEGAVAAVDFQYVGGGVGMKDVAYFFSSVFRDEECAQRAPELIDVYFGHLEFELTRLGTKVDFPSLEREWRSLYSVAWADFYRFLAGWAPGHQKMNSYSERMTREALAQVAPRIPQA